MIIKFQKFQGAGNDFIIIDNRNQVYEFTREIVEYFCDRKFGIGADGLMLLETPMAGKPVCAVTAADASLPMPIAWACFCKPPVSWQQTVNIRAKLPSRAYGLK